MTAVGTYALAPWMLHVGAWENLHVPGRPDPDSSTAVIRARYVDDVWISAHVAVNNVTITAIPGRAKPFTQMPGDLKASRAVSCLDLNKHTTPHFV